MPRLLLAGSTGRIALEQKGVCGQTRLFVW
jgi:hypothetical protein